MLHDVDVRKLSEQTARDRVFLSVYLANPTSVRNLDKKFTRLRNAISPEEREHFDENVKSIHKNLEEQWHT